MSPTGLVLSCFDLGYVAQLLTRAADDKNPIEKAKQAAKVWPRNVVRSPGTTLCSLRFPPQDLGDEVKGNAEGSAEKVEDAYKQANPADGEKNSSDQYRSTDVKNSKEKYTPKSDPKK